MQRQRCALGCHVEYVLRCTRCVLHSEETESLGGEDDGGDEEESGSGGGGLSDVECSFRDGGWIGEEGILLLLFE